MRFILSMPVFNESEGICSFLSEIVDQCNDELDKIFVVDDCSTDETYSFVSEFSRISRVPIEVISLDKNVGHGPATLMGFRAATEYSNLPIVTVDGDGQFLGSSLKKLMAQFQVNQPDVLEGIRINRQEPIYRKITSFATRVLVFLSCGSMPKDANTPLRIYKSDIAKTIIGVLPSEPMTPNMLVSSISRRYHWKILESEVPCYSRRGANSTGTMWASNRVSLPSKRFISFCLLATKQWILPWK